MGWKTIFASVLSACCLNAADVVLKADDNDGKDEIWLKRYDAGKKTWGIVGNHQIESGSMWFDAFPGESGSYEVILGIVAEEDGRPLYRVSAGETVLDSGKYPCPGGSCNCSKNTEPETINLGTHTITRGDRIEMWGQSTYTCDGETLDHGAYARWYEIRFKPVGGNPSPPQISLAVNDLTISPSEGYTIPYGSTEIGITNTGEGTLPELSADPDVDWLSAKVSGSGNSQTVTVNLSQAGLPVGEHAGTVLISAPDLEPGSIAVTCRVSPANTIPQTRIVSPEAGTELIENRKYTLVGKGANLAWHYDANSDNKGKIKIGEGDAVEFVVPYGITGPRTITLFLDGDNGSVERQFDLGIPLITVISPNGGESFTSGETVVIEWKADTSIVTDVDIHYTTNFGIDWEKINESSSITLGSSEWGSYSWKIPENVNSKNCLIRIEKYEATSGTEMDISDTTFEIEASVTAGNGRNHPTPSVSPGLGRRRLGSSVVYSVHGRRIGIPAQENHRLPHGVVIVSTKKGVRREVLRVGR